MANAGGARDFGLFSELKYFLHPSPYNPNTGDFTYLAWGRSTDVTGDFKVLHGISGGSSYSFYWSASNSHRVNIGDLFPDSGTTLEDTWQFGGVTWNDTTGNATVYLSPLNGKVVQVNQFATNNNLSTTADHFIGNYGTSDFPWSGQGGQIIFFDRLLTLSEIEELQYNSYSITDSNIQGNFPLWGVDDPEPDVSGKGRNTNSTVGSPGISDTSPPVFLLGGQ